MFPYHHCRLGGIHTAYPAAIWDIVTHVAGSDTLNEGNGFGWFMVGQSDQIPAGGSSRRQHAFQLHAGQDIVKPGISIFGGFPGIEILHPGRHNHRPHLDIDDSVRLIVINTIFQTGIRTLATY